jgi:sulfur carrier protein
MELLASELSHQNLCIPGRDVLKGPLMRLIINGRSQELAAVTTLQDAVGSCNVANVIALLNDQVIPVSQWANTFLKDGDTLEIVAIVGGG